MYVLFNSGTAIKYSYNHHHKAFFHSVGSDTYINQHYKVSFVRSWNKIIYLYISFNDLSCPIVFLCLSLSNY